MMMKRAFGIVLVSALPVLFVAGCSNSDTKSTETTAKSSSQSSTSTTAGSTGTAGSTSIQATVDTICAKSEEALASMNQGNSADAIAKAQAAMVDIDGPKMAEQVSSDSALAQKYEKCFTNLESVAAGKQPTG